MVLLFCNPVGPYFASDFRSLKPAPPPFPHNTNRAAQRERAFGQTDVTSERKFVSPEIAALGVKLGDAVGTLPAALFAGDLEGWRAEIGERHRTGSRHVLVANGLRRFAVDFNDSFIPID